MIGPKIWTPARPRRPPVIALSCSSPWRPGTRRCFCCQSVESRCKGSQVGC